MNRSALVSILLGAASFAVTFAPARAGLAQTLRPPDVVVHDAPEPRRFLSIGWNPLPTFTIGKASADVVLVPVSHHALVVSPFYAWTTTVPIFVFDDSGAATQLPEQRFTGFGAEIGYRYYAGDGGPRGFFAGPSLIVGSFTATAANGTKTAYLDYGFAADVGYERLLAGRVAITFGGGLQVTTPSKSIPDQQFPANLYANTLVRPRLLLSVGCAL